MVINNNHSRKYCFFSLASLEGIKKNHFSFRYAALLLIFLLFFCLTFPLSVFSDEVETEPLENVLEMSLAEAVSLALRSNRSVQMAYLDRVVQKFALKVAEDKFRPDVDVAAGISRTDTSDETSQSLERTETDSLSDQFSGSVSVSETIPTGGMFAFVWTPTKSDYETDDFQTGFGSTRRASDDYTSSWRISFTQPLLKGGGIDVNTASVSQARLMEKSNILSLKATLISTVTSVITAYRAFQLSRDQVEISKASLERARKLVEINKLLIDSGRMPSVELVQSEAEVASREFAYEGALNNFDRARLALVKVLDIPKHTRFVLAGEGDLRRIVPDLDTCAGTAFENRPDYLQALLNLESTKINVNLAENNRLWDLSFNAAYGESDSRTDHHTDALSSPRLKGVGQEWNAGLNLSVPVWGDLSRKQAVLSAETSLKKTRISLKELKDNVETEVLDAIRDVKTKLKQVDLARLSRDLTEQKLVIEDAKLKAGRSTNFQLVSFQNDLVNAQNAELSAITDYRNALTSLDQVLGTTLDTWRIYYKDDNGNVFSGPEHSENVMKISDGR